MVRLPEVEAVAEWAIAQALKNNMAFGQNLPASDQELSHEPIEFKYIIEWIRGIELAMRYGVKRPSENKNKEDIRQSLIVGKHKKRKENFSRVNIRANIPGIEFSPVQYNDVIGKIAKKCFRKDDLIKL